MIDDDRIQQIRDEVLSELRQPSGRGHGDLEQRVAALEQALSALAAAPAPGVVVAASAAAAPSVHPSLSLLDVRGGADRCLLEPDKPCVKSGQCRRLGH